MDLPVAFQVAIILLLLAPVVHHPAPSAPAQERGGSTEVVLPCSFCLFTE